MTIWLKIIGRTGEDEESGLLMGFGDHCLTRDCGQQDAASELPVLHRDTMQGFQCRVLTVVCCAVEQPVDGQVSGPQVFRKSDHLPHPPPLLNSPSAQNQQRVRKVLKLGLTTLASDPGCVVAVWVEMEKDTLSDPLKEYQEKNVGHKFLARGETLEIGTNLDSGSILTTIIYSHILQVEQGI